MRYDTITWRTLLEPAWLLPSSVLVGGVLLHSMNVLLTATVLPSIVADVGGVAMLSWPTTAYLASSIIAATVTGWLSVAAGARRTFCAGAILYLAGALICAAAPSMPVVIGGRFVQGMGGGLLSALAYVLVRRVFPEPMWQRVFALFAAVWGVSILFGPTLVHAF